MIRTIQYLLGVWPLHAVASDILSHEITTVHMYSPIQDVQIIFCLHLKCPLQIFEEGRILD